MTNRFADAPDVPAHSPRNFDGIAIGDNATMERRLTLRDIQLYSVLSGEQNPDRHAGADSASHGAIAHGMWGVALIGALIGTRLPGPGTTYVSQSLSFFAALDIGDTLQVSIEVAARDESSRQLRLSCLAVKQDGQRVIEGEIVVAPPPDASANGLVSLPELRLRATRREVQRLVDHVRPLGPLRVAVVHPCDAVSLGAALDARALGLIEPVLVAPGRKLHDTARQAGLDLGDVRIEEAAHSHAAAARAAELAANGDVDALMKGSLHTDEFMGAIVASASGLRTKRRISHCFVMQTPAYPRPFIITDAAVNIAPDLQVKADIVRNAIDLARALGVLTPHVAILAAVETVSADMQATLDAAALCKMADRGQIAGGVLDGPLAFDNAVSAAAARIKGIDSPVAGRADVLVVPDMESGNMLAKQLEYLGDASMAGVVVGARVPVILTSRADSLETRLASCAVAMLLANYYRKNPP